VTIVLRALATGVAIGLVYTLSPLFVITMAGLLLLLRWAHRTSDAVERRWVMALLLIAMATRVIAIAALFVSTDHQAVPFGWLFGDEEYFIRRGIWLANLALGIPISLADVHYAFDDLIHTSFVWLLAAVNVLVGPAQYGVRLVSALLYLTGAFAMYRLVRPGFGRPAALLGLALLLFLPSLFAWSLSVLKEPVFFALLAAIIVLTVSASRQPSWAVRGAALAGVIALAYAAETIRDGGLVVAGAGTVAGLMTALAAARPKLLAAAAAIAIIVTPVLLANLRVQDGITAATAAAARRHWAHVNAPGHSYMIFEPSFYRAEPVAGDLTFGDGARLAAGGVFAYLTVPTPWQMRSRAELAYLPEQVIWYGMVILLPFGVAAGFKRDALLTSILLGHLVVAVILVALTSGNIGTLVRHRALAMPYVVWFTGLGLGVVLRVAAGAGRWRPVPLQEAGA
jgi:hypothetical protein